MYWQNVHNSYVIMLCTTFIWQPCLLRLVGRSLAIRCPRKPGESLLVEGSFFLIKKKLLGEEEVQVCSGQVEESLEEPVRVGPVASQSGLSSGGSQLFLRPATSSVCVLYFVT